MGQFLDLARAEHLTDPHPRIDSLEGRVAVLEEELAHTRRALKRLLEILEQKFVIGFDEEEHLSSRIL